MLQNILKMPKKKYFFLNFFRMPSRAKGSAVIIYLEHEDKWVDAEVVDYIRGFGYEVSFELDGLSQSGKNKKMQFFTSFHLKVL